jgi:hypothetical protein
VHETRRIRDITSSTSFAAANALSAASYFFGNANPAAATAIAFFFDLTSRDWTSILDGRLSVQA